MIHRYSYPPTSLKRRSRGYSAERSPEDLPFMGAGRELVTLANIIFCFFSFSIIFDLFWTFLIFLEKFNFSKKFKNVQKRSKMIKKEEKKIKFKKKI